MQYHAMPCLWFAVVTLKSQATTAARWLAAYLDGRAVRSARQYRSFFSRVMVFFRLQRPPVSGWSAVEIRVALTYAAVWVIALSAWQAGRPALIRSPRLVLADV